MIPELFLSQPPYLIGAKQMNVSVHAEKFCLNLNVFLYQVFSGFEKIYFWLGAQILSLKEIKTNFSLVFLIDLKNLNIFSKRF